MSATAPRFDAEAALREAENNFHRPTTRRSYRNAWRRFERWADDAGLDAYPASVEAIKTYLAWLATPEERGGAGLTKSSMELALAAVTHKHEDCDPNPARDRTLRKRTMPGLRSMCRPGPGQAPALDEKRAAQVFSGLEEETRTGNTPKRRANAARDLACLRLMWAAMLRRGEAVGLRWRDIRIIDENAATVTLTRTKTSDEAVTVPITHPPTVAAIKAWREASSHTAPNDSVFGRRYRGRWGRTQPGALNSRFARISRRLGLDVHLSTHSARVGGAVCAARAGATFASIQSKGRWKDGATVSRYLQTAGMDVEGNGTVPLPSI